MRREQAEYRHRAHRGWRLVSVAVVVVVLMLAACSGGGPNSASAGVSTAQPATPLSHTPTVDPASFGPQESAQLLAQFNSGRTAAQVVAATLPSHINLVLLTHLNAGNPIGYHVQTAPNGPAQRIDIPQDFQLFDWNARGSSTAIYILIPQADVEAQIVSAMGSVYVSSSLSLSAATTQIEAGRPAHVDSLNGQVVFLKDLINGVNSDGTVQLVQINQPALIIAAATDIVFSAAHLT